MSIGCIVVSVVTIVGIILFSLFKPNFYIKRIKISTYWIVALIGALIILLSTMLPINIFWENLFNNEGINPLKILVLFLSMTCISIFLDKLGFFSHLANWVLNKVKAKQITLFIVLYFLVSILTIFTSNDIIILTLTPFIIFFCKSAKISPIPYLVGEFMAANTWSMIFIIGNPTNIYIATSFNIDFVTYFKIMAIPTLLAGIVELVLLILLFKKKLKDPIQHNEIKFEPMNKFLVISGLIVLGICTILLIVSSYVQFLEMYYVAFGSLVILVLICLIYSLAKKTKPLELGQTFKAAPYELIPFLLSMFVIALSLKYYGVVESIHNWFGSSLVNIKYGYSSALIANLINNIPMSIFYANIISGLEGSSLNLAIYSSIIGSNIGAFITPLGALAGIMWMNILKEHEIKFTYLDFIKFGLIVGIPVLTVAIFSLQLFI